ncbi:MAG: FKBP-type peptidyl-prolyl cis-trans isomerase [Opitutaceae bacterium]|nr:FKBP-type peptidyl-prolyl cis-trans isomerase [Cytophagales bacterium]
MFATDKENVSYAIGNSIGHNFLSQGIDVDPEIVAMAIKHVLTDSELALTDEEMDDTMRMFQQMMQEKEGEQKSKGGEENRAAGKAFLTDNQRNEGIITTPSGLQYQVIKEGSGPKPNLTDEVTTHYHGTLINGKVFDSSVKRGQPASFPVNGVIAGWTEALQLMPTGSKWKLFIPSELAYGERGAGADIGPGTTLIFEVELLAIR